MRRIPFPAFGVVALLFAYAGQQFAAGAPSAPRASAQDPVMLREMGDEAKVLKHIAAAEMHLLAGLARADDRQRPLINKLERQEAWIEGEADKLLADEHKADHLLAEERDAQTAQAPTPEQRQQAIQQQLIATLADLKAKLDALKGKGGVLTQEEIAEAFELQALYNQTAQLLEQLDGAQLDTLKAVALVSPTSP